MQEIIVFDENYNPVQFDRIKLKGRYELTKYEAQSPGIDFVSYAKYYIAKQMVEEMMKSLFFIERKLPDGGVSIEFETSFYGKEVCNG